MEGLFPHPDKPLMQEGRHSGEDIFTEKAPAPGQRGFL
jgi:hypothetical protein